MALNEVITRKWVKPFILVLTLTLISILTYGNFVYRIGNSAMYIDNGEQVGDTRVSKSQDTSVTKSAASQSLYARNTIPRKHIDQVLRDNIAQKRRPAQTIKIGPHNSQFRPFHRSQNHKRLPHHIDDHVVPKDVSSELQELLDISSGDDFWKYELPEKGDILRSKVDYDMLNETGISLLPHTTSPPFFNPNIFTHVFDKIRDIKVNTNFLKAQEQENIGKTAGQLRAHGKPVFIVVLGRMRTGSTLVGEIFNQNPEVGFIYEPLHAVCDWYKRRMIERRNFDSASSTLLSKLSSCEFPPDFISSITRWPTGGGSRSSMIQPVCAVTSKCKLVTSSSLHQYCLKYHKYRAVKVIRADFDTLVPLVREGLVDVKILHLIRDPRGTANSRRQLYASDRNMMQRRIGMHDYYRSRMLGNSHPVDPFNRHDPRKHPVIYHQTYHYIPRGSRLEMTGLLNPNDVFPAINTIPAYCRWLRATITQVQQKPGWLRGRYKLVRYEDFAEDPISVSEAIYRHFDMSLPERVYQWLVNNTGGNIKGNDRLYGSHKNSSEAAFKWRTVMTAQEASQVERECGDIMERLGYLRTSDRLRMADLEKPLIRPLPDNVPNELWHILVMSQNLIFSYPTGQHKITNLMKVLQIWNL